MIRAADGVNARVWHLMAFEFLLGQTLLNLQSREYLTCLDL